MSQRRLAEELGYDPSFLSRIETGRVRAPRDFLDRLTGVEGLRLSWQDRDRLVQLSGEPAAAGERWPGLVGADPLHSFLSGAFGPRVRREASVNPDEKRALGAYLAGRLERLGRSRRIPMILDSGSTTAFLSQELASLSAAGVRWEVHTGNLLAALLLAGSTPVHLLGGRIDSEFGATLSAEAVNELARLIDRLVSSARDAPEEMAMPVGILSCLAFTADEGPWSRLQEAATSVSLPSGLPRHVRWKETMIDRLPWLIVPLHSEKLLRPGEPLWKEAGPIRRDGVSRWSARLRRAGETDGPVTHLVLVLPRAQADPFHRRAKVLGAVAALLGGSGDSSFAAATELRAPSSGERGANLLTVLDFRTGKALPQGVLSELLEREGGK